MKGSQFIWLPDIIMCWSLLLFVLAAGSFAEPILEISNGKILGIEKIGLDGVPYASYMGIPYAKQPVNELRFRPPEEPEYWEGILNATIEGPNCMQHDVLFGSLHQPKQPMQEACLYINVHTPANSSDDNLPVFFFIHGGAFTQGSGDTDMYGPDFLISKGVILVTFNYRLDVYGLLSLDIPEAPGNIALHDAAAALMWVNKNIAAFGGNAANVTAGGQSSGAAMAHLLTMSNKTKDLFQRLILMSGDALSPWVMSLNNTAQAFEFGAKLNYTTTNATELYNLLRETDVSDMLNATKELMAETGAQIFQVVVEKSFDGVDPFLTKHPYDIINESGNQTDIPYLMGFTSREGIFVIDVLKGYDYVSAANSSGAKFISSDIDTSKLTSDQLTEIEDKLRSFYLKNGTLTEHTYNNSFIDWVSDVYIVYKTIVLARLQTNVTSSPVYMYEFAFDGEFDIMKKTFNLTQYDGVSHIEDLAYIFQVNSFPETMVNGTPEDKARRLMLEMWTNFIKYGNPTPELNDLINVTWEPTSTESLSYVNITTSLFMAEKPMPEHIAFWDDIYTSIGMAIGY